MLDTLERLVDEHGLRAVLEALAEVCGGKAEHVLANWQDKALAKAWDRAGSTLERAAARVGKLLP
jgi:hypothetical protein